MSKQQYNVDSRLYVLKNRDGDYVDKVTGTDWDTVKMCFTFTKDIGKAKRFPAKDIYSRDTTMPYQVFTRGYTGSKLIEVKNKCL